MIRSAKYHNNMGRYTICGNMVTHGEHPVYKKDSGEYFLYSDKNRNWCVGPVVGSNKSGLFQTSEMSPSPNKTQVWKYCCSGEWETDNTLKVYACY